MAFGQTSGPPATARQVAQLLDLIQSAGHSDFRDARGPLGFTQRQAAGKFTRDEAETLISELEDAVGGGDAIDATVAAPTAPTRRRAVAAPDRTLSAVSTPKLAAELQRRGWIVIEP